MKEKEQVKQNRVFMKPGKTNQEDRMNFVRFWADYIRNTPDEEWSSQQNIIIDSQIVNSSKNRKL